MAALIGAVLLAVPGSPIHRKPMLGLDLQGGLEVVLKAVPPKGHSASRRPTWTSLSRSSRAASTSSASRQPEVRKQGTDQIVDPARRRARPGEGGRADRQDGAARDLRLRGRPRSGAVGDRERPADRDPVALRPAHAGAEAGGEGLAGGVLPLPHEDDRRTTKKVTVTGKNGKKTTILKPAKKTVLTHSLLQGPADTQSELLKPYRGQAAGEGAGDEGAGAPSSSSAARSRTAASASTTTSPNASTTTSSSTSRPEGRNGPIPEMTGGDLVAVRHARRLRRRTTTRSSCSSSRATARASSSR